MVHPKYDPDQPHRHSIRIPGYDYSQAGAYFVTMVTWERECLFGEILDREMGLNSLGQTAAIVLQTLPQFFPVQLAEWGIMPNHVHAILAIHQDPCRGAAPGISRVQNSSSMLPGAAPVMPSNSHAVSLGTMLRYFKSTSARRINLLRKTPGAPVWQRNYYEHIIRDEGELTRLCRYIQENPLRWAEDEENR